MCLTNDFKMVMCYTHEFVNKVFNCGCVVIIDLWLNMAIRDLILVVDT
jgi:hypothetical protein